MDQPAPILVETFPPGQEEMAAARLPAMRPVPEAEWLHVDAAYGPQMEEKARLLAVRRAAVIAALPGTEAPLAELYAMVMAALSARADFRVEGGAVTRPDGVRVTADPADPLGTFARLLQEDVCLLERQGDEHVLTAAAVCFPSSWTLAEKIGRPLRRIHRPVPHYDAGIAMRVQRMFDNVPEGTVLMRANLLRHHDPHLFHAYTEANPRPPGRPDSPYLRSERQTIRRLPGRAAVVFTIHTAIRAA